MQFFDEIFQASLAVNRYFYVNQSQLPEHIVPRIETHLTGSPVDLVVTFTRAIYANRSESSSVAKLLAAGCADLIHRKGYHDRLEGRASLMSDVLRRDGGEKAAPGRSWPKPSGDPVPDYDFLPPAGTLE